MTVKMHSDMPYDDFVDPYKITEIVDSRTFMGGAWRSLTTLQDFTNGIDKFVLPIKLEQYRIFVVTRVVAGRIIKSHSHDDEPMFRYLVAGSFDLNGIKYNTGEWVIVPIGLNYEIYTEDGYTSIAPYGMSCECSGVGGH